MAQNKAYYKAKKVIERVWRSGKKELNLSNFSLSELPKSLLQLRQLQSLDLSGNRLTSLPEWFGQLTKLQLLKISNNQLTTLPESMGKLSRLLFCDLSGNEFMALPESLGQLTQLDELYIGNNSFEVLPELIGKLVQLKSLDLSFNKLQKIPDWISNLKELHYLAIGDNFIKQLPDSLGDCTKINYLDLCYIDRSSFLEDFPSCIKRFQKLEVFLAHNCNLKFLPEWFGNLRLIKAIDIRYNQIQDIPRSIVQLEHLESLNLDGNPLNPELAVAYKQGLNAVKTYLRAKAEAQITLNEAKLILVGEGEVGKTCLMDALAGNSWQEHDTTHGIEIKQIKITGSDRHKEITLNGWDFGGQRVYRPTHQLFFSAPAVYIVVWKPREGPQQGFVKEWIKLVKHREPDAKILVVATHGGPQQRQPDIDRQELRDLFGEDTVIDFFFVESKPDENGNRKGIEELKQAIVRVASALPEVGRSVPKRWQDARETLINIKVAYLPLTNVLELCLGHKMDEDEARLFVTIEHRSGHLIHYQHDPALRDIVILKPDWLSTAMSFILDDEATRNSHGLISFSHMNKLWNDKNRPVEARYPEELHPIFLRLMERFDLSYRVVGMSLNDFTDATSLIAQLVPDNRPEKDLEREWPFILKTGDIQQIQICRIVDVGNGQSATAEGLFYQLIVRLHKYSLGRINYKESVHWQRGLVVDDDYNGRALLEFIGNDIRISVRASYPERFLSVLTGEVKYLVDSFWTGLRCDVMVPCVEPCGKKLPGSGLFEVEKLIESKRRNRPEYPCPVCNEWQNIDCLLRNAPAARPMRFEELFNNMSVLEEIRKLRTLLVDQQEETRGRFDNLDTGQRELLSKSDAAFTSLMQVLTDEAKEGPRLFSFVPVDRKVFNPKKWTSAKFRLTLWCEHSRLPLPSLNGLKSKNGVYELERSHEWFKKASPYLKFMVGTLSLILPVASSAVKLTLDDNAYKVIEEELDFGKEFINALLEGTEKIDEWFESKDSLSFEHGEAIRAKGASLRELHALLKKEDPGFGGLVRVINKRQEFLWVHPQFEKEY